MLFRALSKRQLKISLVLTHNALFAVFHFERRRTKFLKSQRTFYARIFTGEINIGDTLEQLRIWLEGITEDYLLEKLEDSPLKYRPVIKVTPKIKLDFNVTEDEVKALLWHPS
jgi:hypothetical protein